MEEQEYLQEFYEQENQPANKQDEDPMEEIATPISLIQDIEDFNGDQIQNLDLEGEDYSESLFDKEEDQNIGVDIEEHDEGREQEIIFSNEQPIHSQSPVAEHKNKKLVSHIQSKINSTVKPAARKKIQVISNNIKT